MTRCSCALSPMMADLAGADDRAVDPLRPAGALLRGVDGRRRRLGADRAQGDARTRAWTRPSWRRSGGSSGRGGSARSIECEFHDTVGQVFSSESIEAALDNDVRPLFPGVRRAMTRPEPFLVGLDLGQSPRPDRAGGPREGAGPRRRGQARRATAGGTSWPRTTSSTSSGTRSGLAYPDMVEKVAELLRRPAMQAAGQPAAGDRRDGGGPRRGRPVPRGEARGPRRADHDHLGRRGDEGPVEQDGGDLLPRGQARPGGGGAGGAWTRGGCGSPRRWRWPRRW